MSVQLYVTKSELGVAASALEKAVDALEQQVNRVNNTAQNLATMWEGESHDTFMTQHERYLEYDRQLIQTTRDLIDAIKTAQQTYTDTDLEMARLLRS